jgi:hypothetical protein
MAAVRGNNRWLVLPIAVTGFLLQHAIQGWCPPIPVLWRLASAPPMKLKKNGKL